MNTALVYAITFGVGIVAAFLIEAGCFSGRDRR